MSFLKLESKRFLIFGVANKKSVAFQIAKMLLEEHAAVDLVVQNESIADKVRLLFPEQSIFICNVEDENSIISLSETLRKHLNVSDSANSNSGERHSGECQYYSGLVHSIAFADYSGGMKPFYETPKRAFLQAMDISCFSLVTISGQLRDLLAKDASVVTISISTTRMASENYGFMAPIKAALDSSLSFLAKSFSEFSEIRFNAVAPGLLKTSASAGIPGYADSYIFAEQAIPRKRALATEEAAATAVFLLSQRSSGINAQKIIVDAGMEINYFDKKIIKKVNE
ncbi:MAG: SDR family oxidoreductase [Planctomycetaceae bacterium]|jgi:enoyl-[acyl-carrier protein] reductase I|nr:SDR family oxidoreductase [Planctomycetaceae bacterium]